MHFGTVWGQGVILTKKLSLLGAPSINVISFIETKQGLSITYSNFSVENDVSKGLHFVKEQI